jgi:hypothetical protein
MRKVKNKYQVNKHITLILITVIVMLIIASIIGAIIQQLTILSLNKDVSLMSQKIKEMNAVPIATPTDMPTPTPTSIPWPTATPTPALDKAKLNQCLQNAVNAYTKGWDDDCQTRQDICVKYGLSDCQTTDPSTNCKLSVSQADYLENLEANTKNDCYSQYYAGN